MKVTLIRSHRGEEEGQSCSNHRPPVGIQRGSVLEAPVRILIILLLIATLGMPLSLNAEQGKGLGMWVWSNSSFQTEEARLQLVQFCVEHRITHLDVHTKVTHNGSEPILKDAEAFKALIALAGQHNITTAALRGNPKMFFSENHERTLQELRAIVAFCETLPRDTLFRGVNYPAAELLVIKNQKLTVLDADT